jgi:hypothetical protein
MGVVANHEVLHEGKPTVLPANTQFSYLDPHMGAIRDALQEGFSVSINVNVVGAKPTAVYEVMVNREPIGELVAGCGVLLGADYEGPVYHEIEKFGADGSLRKKIIDSLESGFPIFLIPRKGVGEGVHYELWCANYDNS